MHQVKGLKPNGDILIKKIPDIKDWIPMKKPLTDNIIKIGIIDVETTGLDKVYDEIIEIGFIQVVLESNRIIAIENKFNAFNQPSCSITDKITHITGITNEMVKDQSVDYDILNKHFMKVDYVISHYAQFDRGFIDKVVPISKDKIWGCSLRQIPWQKLGHCSASLEALCKDHGFWFNNHRAINDCMGLAFLLQQDQGSGIYFNNIIKDLNKKKIIIYVKVAYHFKDYMRGLGGWLWNFDMKKNWKIIDKQDLQSVADEIIKYCKNADISFIDIAPNDLWKM